jgi:prepilin-type processing-associated H-X9-DG protein
VFTDEHPDSINDGWMITDMTNPFTWVDLPANYHNRGCGFSFADGHSTIHKWLDGNTTQPVTMSQHNGGWGSSPRDMLWMQQHASAPYGSTH